MSAREFSAFNADSVRHAVRQPPFDELWSAARTRRRRRAAGAALATVVVVAGMALGPLAGRPAGVHLAGPGRADQRVPGAELFLVGERSLVGVRVTNYGCDISFANTRDLGRTWSAFRPIRHENTCRIEDGKGRSVVSYHPLGVRTYLVSVDGRSYLSTDEGRTWQDADSAMVPVDAFPPEAEPVSCQVSCSGVPEPMAVEPRTGAAYRLRAAPPPYPLTSMYESPDGTLWATYQPGDIAEPAVVARSTDRGATWQQSVGPTGVATIAVAGQNAQIAYLLAEPRSPMGEQAPAGSRSTLLRTTDGGQTWRDVGTDLPTSDPIRSIVVGWDGSVLVGDWDRDDAFVRISRDGGRHFTTGMRSPEGGFTAAPGRILLMGLDGVWLTTDGRTGRQLSWPD